MPVGKGQILFPIELGHIVLAAADVVTDGAHDRLIQRRHFLAGQTVCAQEPVDRVSPLAAKNSPLGSAQRSSSALATYTGRGAIRAISMC